MSGVMSKVAFASKISVLMKTTSDDQNSTPGYLYGEVTKISFESVEYCEHMVEFLMSRLKKKSLNVKLKTLLVLRNVLDKGSAEFNRSLRKQSGDIKEMKTFSGPPDPLLGDSMYMSIRKTAGEVLDILFDTEKGASVGVGSATQVASAPKMEGFGVSATPEAPKEGSVIHSVFDKIKETVPQLKAASDYMFPPSQTNSSGAAPAATSANQDYQCFGGAQESAPTWSSNTLTNFFGSSSVEGNDKTEAINAYGSSLGSTSTSNWLTKTGSDGPLPAKPKDYKIDLHETEKRIVEDIVTPQGLRSQPTTQDTFTFIQKCEALDCNVVVSLLAENLAHQDTRVQLRTMCVLESLVTSKKLPGISDIVRETCENILKGFLTSSHISSREKAKKVLGILDEDDAGVAQTDSNVFDGLQIHSKSTAPASAAAPAPQVNPLEAFLSDVSPTSNASDPFNMPDVTGPTGMNKPMGSTELSSANKPSYTQNTQSTQGNTGTQGDFLDFNLDPFADISTTKPQQPGTPGPSMAVTQALPIVNPSNNFSSGVTQMSSGQDFLGFSSANSGGVNKAPVSVDFLADFGNLSASSNLGHSSQNSQFGNTDDSNITSNNKSFSSDQNTMFSTNSSDSGFDLFDGMQVKNSPMSSLSAKQKPQTTTSADKLLTAHRTTPNKNLTTVSQSGSMNALSGTTNLQSNSLDALSSFFGDNLSQTTQPMIRQELKTQQQQQQPIPQQQQQIPQQQQQIPQQQQQIPQQQQQRSNNYSSINSTMTPTSLMPQQNVAQFNTPNKQPQQPQQFNTNRHSMPQMTNYPQQFQQPHNFQQQSHFQQQPQYFQQQPNLMNMSQLQSSPRPSGMSYQSPGRMQCVPGNSSFPNNNYGYPVSVNGPGTGSNLNFLSPRSGGGKVSSNDSFNFVQDAMKASIKK